MKNQRISRKLAIAFGIVIAITIVAFGVVLQSVFRVNSAADHAEKAYQTALDVDEIQVAVLEQYSLLKSMLLDGKADTFLPIYLGYQERLGPQLDAAGEHASEQPEIRKDIDQLRATVQKVSADALMPLIKMIDDPAQVDAARKMMTDNKVYPMVKPLFDAVSGLKKKIAIEVEAANQAKGNSINTLIWTLIVAGLLTVITALVLGRLLNSNITHPVKMVTSIMEAMTNGQLDVKIEALQRRDEIGSMMQAMKTFSESLRENEALKREAEARQREDLEKANKRQSLTDQFGIDVHELLALFKKAEDTLKKSASTMQQQAEDGQTTAATVAAAAEEAHVNSQTVATATEEMSVSIREIASQMNKISDTTGAAVERTEESREYIIALNTATARIGDVVNLVTDIAQQTNLLALNATIEAARAGEAGKGFAVVAGEVKNLATQTSRALDDIAEQIEAIQSASKNSTEQFEMIGDIIAEINTISATVAAAVEEQSSASTEISRSIDQVAAGARDVSGSVTTIQHITETTRTEAMSVSSASKDLETQSTRLTHTVEKFVQNVQAV
ncbi:methyl-accepting chemotaxis protein [Thalassospira lucentensis]|uniref:methyl-accepting chemotaxis protein n=1 Tax=Thalassospira lucentensis TaxID=168935 RepID=UPI003D2EDBC1